jgi:outer membrane protein assembly factor BamB
MEKSDLLYVRGDPVTVGEHGEHDLLHVRGKPVPDAGVSDLVFERGTGIGLYTGEGSVPELSGEYLVCLSDGTDPSESQGDWEGEYANARMSSKASVAGPVEKPSVVWIARVPSAAADIVTQSGNVIAATDHQVFAHDQETGERVWTYEVSDGYVSTVSSGPRAGGGNVILDNVDRDDGPDRIICLSASDGSEKWNIGQDTIYDGLNGRDIGAVTDGGVFVTLQGGTVARLSIDTGEREWIIMTQFDGSVPDSYDGPVSSLADYSDPVIGSVAAGEGGVHVLFETDDGNRYSIHTFDASTGSEEWVYRSKDKNVEGETIEETFSTDSIFLDDGTIYFVSVVPGYDDRPTYVFRQALSASDGTQKFEVSGSVEDPEVNRGPARDLSPSEYVHPNGQINRYSKQDGSFLGSISWDEDRVFDTHASTDNGIYALKFGEGERIRVFDPTTFEERWRISEGGGFAVRDGDILRAIEANRSEALQDLDPIFFESFESGGADSWDYPEEESFEVVEDSDYAQRGSYYVRASLAGKTPASTTVVPGGIQPLTFSYAFDGFDPDTSDGGAVRLRNSNGEVECSFMTNGPQWEVEDANGITQIDSGESGWVLVSAIFYWDVAFSVTFEGGLSAGYNGKLIHGVDIETIEISQYSDGSFTGTLLD